MKVSIVVAVAENGVIGRAGDLPWRLSEDLRRFKALTTGRSCIMGRRTWETLGGPLPNRRNIVITRQADYRAEGADVCRSLDEAIASCAEEGEVFILGGAEIYRLALPHCDRMYMTIVHARPEGDTRFPAWDPQQWTLVSDEYVPAGDRNDHAMSFRLYERAATVSSADVA